MFDPRENKGIMGSPIFLSSPAKSAPSLTWISSSVQKAHSQGSGEACVGFVGAKFACYQDKHLGAFVIDTTVGLPVYSRTKK